MSSRQPVAGPAGSGCTDPRCTVTGPHFPVARFALPLPISLWADLSKAVGKAMRRHGYDGLLLADGVHDPQTVWAVPVAAPAAPTGPPAG